MIIDADRHGGCLTVDGDPRITRVGRWLRRFKLDELPQLVNVVTGDLSLVGPRPEVREYVERHQREHRALLTVRPGLTDLASLEYIDEAAILGRADDAQAVYLASVLRDKLRLALDYVSRASVALDLWILVRTVCAVIRTSRRSVDRREVRDAPCTVER